MTCTQCGVEMPPEAQFCPACGTQVIRIPPTARITWNPEQAEGALGRLRQSGIAGGIISLHYAGFWLRALAYAIDVAVIVLVTTPVLGIVGPLTGPRWQQYSQLPPSQFFNAQNPAVFGFLEVALPIAFVCGWLYYGLFESSSWQGTPGKKLLGLRVSDLQGRPVSFGRSTGRFLGRVIEGVVPFGLIGYAFAAFTARKQAVHDMIAGCLVLRDR